MKRILKSTFKEQKSLFKNFLFLILFLFYSTLNAQEVPTEIVEGISTENAVEIIKEAAKDLKFSILRQNANQKTVETRFFEWTSLVITNRAKLYFEAKDDQVIITMIERQYKSSEGWTDSPTNLSKKNQKKYLGVFTKKIKEIASKYGTTSTIVTNSPKINPSATTSTATQTTNKTTTGIYENFAFAKTENPEMPLIAIHKDGSILGFQLAEDNKRITSITFKKDIDSERFILFLDEEGNPKNGGFGDYIYKFQKIDDTYYKSITYSKSGNLIGEKNIEFSSFDPTQINIPGTNQKGPNAEYIEFSTLKYTELNDWVQNASFVLNVVSCGMALPTGLGAIGPCGTLILGEILKTLPENHIYYKKLVLAKEMLSLITFTSPSGFIEKLTTIVGSMATSSGEINGILNKYFPDVEIEPLIEASKTSYTKTNGIAQVLLKYSQFSAEKSKKIAVYILNDDGSTTFFDDKIIENTEGEVTFELPFNGKYEAQIIYDGALKNSKASFTITGTNPVSKTKFSNANCLSFSFDATMSIEQHHSDGKVSTMPFQSFSIKESRCTELLRNKRGYITLEPIKITWSGTTFYAVYSSVENFFGETDISVTATGKINANGSKLEYITLKSSKNYLSSDKKRYRIYMHEATITNIPFDAKQGQFILYNAPNSIKNIKYLNKEGNYEANSHYKSINIDTDGLKLKENKFYFKLKFFSLHY